MSPSTAVQFDKVSFSYGKLTVLDGLTVQIPQGQICGILGANGAGKSTTMRLLMGLIKPSNGSVTVLGKKPHRNNLRRIGYMPQLNALYEELSVKQNIEFFARMYGLGSKEERNVNVDEVISIVGLDDRCGDPVSNLSGGMRQRVSLGIALSHSPDLLVLDEPTVGLDPQLRASFWEHFITLSEKGITLVISSHTMDDANHCQRLLFLQEGRVVADGSPKDLCKAVGLPQATLEDAFLHFVLKETQ